MSEGSNNSSESLVEGSMGWEDSDAEQENVNEVLQGDENKIINDLLGPRDHFLSITRGISLLEDEDFRVDNIDRYMKELQLKLFRSPTYVEDNMLLAKQEREAKERLRLKQELLLREEKAREAESRAGAFQFDFGYLDAEVYDLLKQLESVYPDIRPMPDTSTSKSVYTTTKANLDKMGLKVILNRICLIGKYKQPQLESERDSGSVEDISKIFQERLRIIRLRADSIFAKELGEITGCLLNYPDCFLLMMEGPELSIMDVMSEGTELLLGSISEGCVLFVAPHVLVRFLQDWTDINRKPSPSFKAPDYREDVDTAKEILLQLSEKCESLWREVALVKHKSIQVVDYLRRDVLPDESVLKYATTCPLLRPLHLWLNRITRMTYGDFTSDSWPHMWYPVPCNSHKPDMQFDSLGILDTFENIPGINERLEEFLNGKTVWKSREENTKSDVKDRFTNSGTIARTLSAISKSTAYAN